MPLPFRRTFATAVALAAFLLDPLAAQSLTGRVVDPSLVGIGGIFVEPNNGAAGVTTDPLGNFTILGLQNRSYDVAYRAPFGVTWVARLTTVTVSGATNVGDVVLQPGHQLTGTVHTTAAVPVAGCNMNVYDQATGVKLYTPYDSTDLLGNFLLIVPTGTFRVRAVPPTGSLLVPREISNVVVAGPTSTGIIQVSPGFTITGSVVDTVTSVPLANIVLSAENGLTGESIPVGNVTTTTFGQFSMLLPFGLVHLTFDPPAGNTHVGAQLFDLPVIRTQSIGAIGLRNGVLLSGTVTGPAGPVANADVDVVATDGSKLYTPHDNTSATGVFSVAVPTGTWRVRVEPPLAHGLVGELTAPLAVNAATNAGTIVLQAGVILSGNISGPLGPEVKADLDVIDPVTGTEFVIVGDETDAAGNYAAVVPNGTFDVQIDSAEGSRGRPVRVQGVVVNGNTVLNRVLAQKDLVVTCTSYGIPTVLQGGPLPINMTVHNLTPAFLPTLLDLAILYPSGAETLLLPGLPIDVVPGIPLSLGGIWLTLPPVPAAETGKLIKFLIRFRNPVTNAVIDQATTEFVVL